MWKGRGDRILLIAYYLLENKAEKLSVLVELGSSGRVVWKQRGFKFFLLCVIFLFKTNEANILLTTRFWILAVDYSLCFSAFKTFSKVYTHAYTISYTA